MSDLTGNPVNPVAYTAFGERISGTNHPYGYAGAWGYQTHDDFPFLHVGHRYYDPASGRFLQRDPIGIAGGLNVYVYARSRPERLVDPLGLDGFVDGFVDEFTHNVEVGTAFGGAIGGFAGGVVGGISGSVIPGAGTLAGVGAGGLGGITTCDRMDRGPIRA